MVSTNENLRDLRCGIVLRVCEEACEVRYGGQLHPARYAKQFPAPRSERVSPGHLVAMVIGADGSATVVWRWYDAVLLGPADDDLIGLWEPAHGELLARPRPSYRVAEPGSRAYLSAGLPGADWWVAGPAMAVPEAADVELDAVENLYTEHGLWDELA